MDLPDPTRRMVLMLTTAVASAGVIGYRLFDWHVQQATTLSGRGAKALLTRHEIDPRRGSILDRTGAVLAISRGTTRVIADPKEIHDKSDMFKIAERLTDLLNLDVGTVAEKLSNPESRYSEIAREVPDGPATRIREAINEEDETKKLHGVRLEADKKRVYPNQELAAHVLGFVGESAARPNDVVGQAGIEAYYDDHLGGQPGLVRSDVDRYGHRIPIGRHSMQQPRHGSDIILAIDRTIQHIVEQELTAALKKYNAAAGSILITNPKTGEVLGLANRPTFDPGLVHQYRQFGPEMENRSRALWYEPGSTFKLITMAAGLNENLISPDSTHNNPGVLEYAGQEFKNWDEKTYPNQTMTSVLQHSSNTGSIFVADKLGKQTFYQYVDRFGFGTGTGIDLEEVGGLVRRFGDPNWYPPDLASNSFGHGITVTHIQLAAAIGAIANDGILMAPRVARALTHADGRRENIEPFAVRRVIRKETSQTLIQMMEVAERMVIPNLAKIPGYRTAGKTGTAQIAHQGSYADAEAHASYVGFGPLEQPQVLALVVIEKPQKGTYGAEVAAPTFAKVISRIFAYLKIPKRSSVS